MRTELVGHYLLFLLMISLTGCWVQPPEGRFTVRVTDTDGSPISGAQIMATDLHDTVRGTTDKDGNCLIRVLTPKGGVDLSVDHNGYYPIYRLIYEFKSHQNGRYLPWDNTVELRLHKIGRSVPMFVRKIHLAIPELDRAIGFDLLVSDWVRPYGHGTNSDFSFLAERWMREDNRIAGRLKISFPNSGDGLFRVRVPYRNSYGLKLPALAPIGGYQGPWELRLRSEMDSDPSRVTADLNFDQDVNYFFRVRSRRQSEGGPEEGVYGKIYDGISFRVWEARTNVVIQFLYYLNPDGTRNTEWDTRSNLCSNPGDISLRP